MAGCSLPFDSVSFYCIGVYHKPSEEAMTQNSEATVRRELLIIKIKEAIKSKESDIVEKGQYLDGQTPGTEHYRTHLSQFDYMKGHRRGLMEALELVQAWA